MAGTATVAILFVDMVGSTDILRRIGDDANDELRVRYMASLRQAVNDAGGREVKNLGDGLMAVFEHSVADAASAAIAMQRSVDRLSKADRLVDIQIRVGLSVGEAAPGEAGDWQGTPVVEAARLEPKARPGQILANDVVRQLLGNRGGFVCTPSGDFELKGFTEPLPTCDIAWEPDPGLAEVPLPAGLGRGALELAGRDREMAILRGRWESASSGGAATVVVAGEPGQGKTRLAAELAEVAHSDGATVLYGRCDPESIVVDQPVAEALRWYVAACEPAALREQAAGTQALVNLVPSLAARLPEFASPTTPIADRGEMTSAVIGFITRAAAAQPVLLVLDDLQDASVPTLQLIAGLAKAAAPGLMLLALSRRDDELGDVAGVERIVLDGLAVEGAAQLVRSRLAMLPDPLRVDVDVEDIAASVVSETGGNPQHVLEVIDHVISAGGLSADQETQRAAVVAAAAETCPYKGLLAFQPEDAEIFFGRDEDVAALLSRLASQHLLAVVGASGSGKSSIVRAGVLPALRRGALAGSARWPIAILAPGPHPLMELAAACAAQLGTSAGALLARLDGNPAGLAEAVRESGNDKLVVFVDQFEEVFTLCDDPTERSRFIDALLGAAAAPGGPVLVLLAMRADFFGFGASVPGLGAALEASTALLGPMDEAEMRTAIEGPARVAGLKVERGVVDLMLRDVAGEPGSLPLLSHALLETWKRRTDRTLTLAGYRECGGVRGAIARTAEAVYVGLPADQQQLARSVFLRLTELGEGTEDTRRRVTLDELRAEGEASPDLDELLRTLTDARLLTTSEHTVEVAHEALIREWPRLRSWLDQDREGIRTLRHLTDAARAWDDLGRDTAELYRGQRLVAALDWSRGETATLSPRERAFLDEGRGYADRERRDAERRTRRLHALLGAVAVLAAVSLIAGVVAFGQRNSARESTTQAEARRISTLALTVDDFDQALLLAVEARRLDDSVDTRSNLLAVLNAKPQVVGVIGNDPGDALFDFALTGDGKHLATPRISGVSIYDAETLRPTGASFDADVEWHDALPMADGAGIAVLDMSGEEEEGRVPSVRFFDGTTGKTTRAAIPVFDKGIEDFWPEPSMALSPDGRWLAVSSAANNEAAVPAYEMIWDLAEPSLLPRRVEHGFDFPVVQFTHNNRLVVAGDGDAPQAGVTVIDPATGTVLQTIPSAHAPIALDPTGPRLLARTNDQMALWNLDTRTVEHELPSNWSVRDVAFAPDGSTVATAWQDRTITIWDVGKGEPVERLAGHTSPVENLQYVDGGSTLYTTGADGVVIAWDLAGDRRVVSQLKHPDSGPLPVINVAPSPDARSVAYVFESDDGGDFGFFDVRNRELGPLYETRHGFVGWHDWTANGRHLVTIGRDEPIARLWDPKSGAMVAERQLPFDSPGGSIGSRPGGTSVFAGLHEPGGVVELDAQTLDVIGKPMRFDTYVSNVDISPDGRILAVALFGGPGKNTVALFDNATKKRRATLKNVDASWKLVFSPDGRALAAGGNNGLVTLIDPSNGERIGAPLRGVDGPVSSLAFSPDGALLATGSFDGTLELWDLERRARVARVTPGDPGRATFVWFDSTGENLFAAGEDGGVWTLPASPRDWASRACAIAGRNLSSSEWRELMGDRRYQKTCPGLRT